MEIVKNGKKKKMEKNGRKWKRVKNNGENQNKMTIMLKSFFW